MKDFYKVEEAYGKERFSGTLMCTWRTSSLNFTKLWHEWWGTRSWGGSSRRKPDLGRSAERSSCFTLKMIAC